MRGKWRLRRARRQLGQGRVAEENRTYRTLSADVEWFAEYGRRSWGAHNSYLTLMRLFAEYRMQVGTRRGRQFKVSISRRFEGMILQDLLSCRMSIN